ncbi:Conserved_hypothetical protein [Hexamita inflata]|uniref:Uncharacterized protein n=1 Tax=Hexamita inflata TaxID=28002 RepID=A0AA86P5T3_9EUKA|nr:Conserved hypothetical protein [Hexamita inflata]
MNYGGFINGGNKVVGFGQTSTIGFGQQRPAVGFGQQTAGYGANNGANNGFGQQTNTNVQQPAVGFQSNFNGYGQQNQPAQQGFVQPVQQQLPIQQNPNPQIFQLASTPIYTVTWNNILVSAHVSGLINFQPQGAAAYSINLNVQILACDQLGNELACATAQGICIVNLQLGQFKQSTPYAMPVGKVRYVSQDFLLASFVDLQNGAIMTVPAKQAGGVSRWSQPTQQQNPDAILYSIVLVNLNNDQILTEIPGLPCNGQFDVEIMDSQVTSYSKDMCRVYIPCLTQYIDDDYFVKCYSAKGSTSSPFKFIEDSGKISKSTFGVDQINAGISSYSFNKLKQVHCLVLESGEIYCYQKSSSSSSYSNSYNRYGSNNKTSSGSTSSFKFNFGMRINCTCFVEKENILVIGLQTGQIAVMQAGKEPQLVQQVQGEVTSITCLGLQDAMFVGIGSMQNITATTGCGIQIMALISDGRGGYAAQ